MTDATMDGEKDEGLTGLLNAESWEPLKIVYSRLRINVDGFVASVTASLGYFNQFDREIQIVFVYKDTACYVTHLRATVDNERVVLDHYNDTMLGPYAFLIGTIPANAKVQLEIGVLSHLESSGEALRYITTQTFTPLKSSKTSRAAKKPYDFHMQMSVAMPCLLAGCFSPTHSIQVDADANALNAENVLVTLAEPYKHDRLIEIFIYPSRTRDPFVTIELGDEMVRAKRNDFQNNSIIAVSCFPTNITNFAPEMDNFASKRNKFAPKTSFPPNATKFAPNVTIFPPKGQFSSPRTSNCAEYVFMVDRSGSMSGSHICDARESLVLFLKSLPITVTFNVVSFGSYSRSLFPTSQKYTQETLEKACVYANSMRADMGGSELLKPLQLVMEQGLASGRIRNIFLLTDGDFSNPEIIEDYLKSNCSKTRVFTFGIGPKIFHDIVRSIAEAGNGKAFFASSTATIQTKIIQCLKETFKPVLCNIKVEWELPESFQIRHCCRDIPFAVVNERLNVYASVTMPARKRYSLREFHYDQSGVKEFWFDEDFDSCQLGDVFIDENWDEYELEWTSDACSQCSDYEERAADNGDGGSEDEVRNDERYTKSEEDCSDSQESETNSSRGSNHHRIDGTGSEHHAFITDDGFLDHGNPEETNHQAMYHTDDHTMDDDTDFCDQVITDDHQSNVVTRHDQRCYQDDDQIRVDGPENDGDKVGSEQNFMPSSTMVIMSENDHEDPTILLQTTTTTINNNLSASDNGTITNNHTISTINHKDNNNELSTALMTNATTIDHLPDDHIGTTPENTISHRVTTTSPWSDTVVPNTTTLGEKNNETTIDNGTITNVDQDGSGAYDNHIDIVNNTVFFHRCCERPVNKSTGSSADPFLLRKMLLTNKLTYAEKTTTTSRNLVRKTSLDTRIKLSPKRINSTSREKIPECEHSNSAYSPCEWGSLHITGQIGADVYTERIPLCIKATASSAETYNLHRKAARSFIRDLERSLDKAPDEDSIKREIRELSKVSGIPCRFTTRQEVDDDSGELRCLTPEFDNYNYCSEQLESNIMVDRRRSSARSRGGDDQTPSILVSCPSVDESQTTRIQARCAPSWNAMPEHSSDEDTKYYRLERLAPEGCDQVRPVRDPTRKKAPVIDYRRASTIHRRRLVSARLTLLSRKMKNAQKLNLFAGPPFIRFILLQSADGYWQLTYAFARIIGLPLVQLELASPFVDSTMIPLGDQEQKLGIDGYFDSLTLWATAVALAYMKHKWRVHEQEWVLVVDKASTWLQGRSLPHGFEFPDIMLAAKQAIVLLEQRYRSRACSEPVSLYDARKP